MAIKKLSEEQIQTMSLEEKDRWWLANVFRGDMPQLTLRAGITGFILGGLLSATNLYIGARTGWTLGVGLTSVILAFAIFRMLHSTGRFKDFTILENNAMQSIATSAGYMTSPLVASFAAYMMMTNQVVPWWQIIAWNVVLSILGVLVAFPLKRRFINDEQHPFPEGRACGVVLDTLYSNAEEADAAKRDEAQGKFATQATKKAVNQGLIKAYALLGAGLFAGAISFVSGESYQRFLQVRLLGQTTYYYLSDKLDGWYYALAAKLPWLPTKIAGIPLTELGLRPSLDVAMIGAGGLMGTRVANSLLVGMLINFFIVCPWMIRMGEIPPRSGEFLLNAAGEFVDIGTAVFGRPWLINKWCLWWGIAMMVAASLAALFAKPKVIISAFTGVFSKRKTANVLEDIELPLWITYVGVPIFVFLGVWMGHEFFGITWWHGLLAIPLIIVLTLIAVNSTALTGTTPGGSISKITQFAIGSLDRANPATNLMTAGMTGEVALNASNLLMDIKPGYMLGGKPRHQAWAHVIGIISGAIASTPLFFLMFLTPSSKDGAAPSSGGVLSFMDGPPPGTNLQELMIDEKFSMPGALQWKGVAELIRDGAQALPQSALYAMFIAAAVAVFMEIARIASKGKFPLSALAIGLGVVIPPDSTLMMWLGAMFFWLMGRMFARRKGETVHTVLVDSQEPICAGLIAGAAIIGIGDKLVDLFLL